MIRDIPKITEIRGSDRTLTFLKSGLFNKFYLLMRYAEFARLRMSNVLVTYHIG